MVSKLLRKRFAVTAALCGALLAEPATAQPFMPMGSFEAVAYPVAITPIPLKLSRNKPTPSSAGATGPSAASAQSAATPTTYRASADVTRRVKRQVADFVGQHGGDAAGFAAAMEREDFFARWGRHVAQYGLRRGDVADAMTAYWMLNWQIANDVHHVSRDQVLAVKRQVVPAMAGDSAFRRLNDAGKQELAEALILNFIIQSVAYEDALKAGDATMQRRLQDAAVARFRNEMDIDLRQVRLSNDGLAVH